MPLNMLLHGIGCKRAHALAHTHNPKTYRYLTISIDFSVYASKSLIVNQFHFYIVHTKLYYYVRCFNLGSDFVSFCTRLIAQATLISYTLTHICLNHIHLFNVLPTSTCSRSFDHSFIHTQTHICSPSAHAIGCARARASTHPAQM